MQAVSILIAEDDLDDRFLLEAAFKQNGYKDHLTFVENGVEVLDYFQHPDGHILPAAQYPAFYFIRLKYAQKRWPGSAKRTKSAQGAPCYSCNYF